MSDLKLAAEAIREADAILITAGAGMGVDSGLPDFRGDNGFWKAYPPYQKLKVGFSAMADPTWFRSDPKFAWGFYGHRRNLYRKTVPHGGYAILRKWATQRSDNYFVFTSNVDNAFKKAGFADDKIVECHGAIEWNQCTCGVGITAAGDEEVVIDMETMRATDNVPTCPGCGKGTRPNIMMFGDPYWAAKRTDTQLGHYYNWTGPQAGKNVVVVECGAGVEIPSVRCQSEDMAKEIGGTLIRINPVHDRVPKGHLSLKMGALEALQKLDSII